MESITLIIEGLILLCTALGGFRQYILKPYFDHRDEERRWKEKLEKIKEEKEHEREEHQNERTKMLSSKYDQLVNSITSLSRLVEDLRAGQQQMKIDEARFDERFDALENRMDILQERVDRHD